MLTRKTIACFAALALFTVCGFVVKRAVALQTGHQTRLGIRNHIYEAPLEVVGVKFNGRGISAGEPFQANHDWLKALVITVKNTSDRDLLGVGASIQFPYDDGSELKPVLPEIEFQSGFNPISNPSGASSFLLRPGETVDLHLTEGWIPAVDSVVRMAEGLNRISLVHNVIVEPRLAVFSDTEVWDTGAFRRFGEGKWKTDQGKMKKVALEVREYLKRTPKMIKVGMLGQERRCLCDADCEAQACGGSCPECVKCANTTVTEMSPGWRERTLFKFCYKANPSGPGTVNCSCIYLVTELNYAQNC